VPVLARLEWHRDKGGGPQADWRHQPQHLSETGAVDQNFGTGEETCNMVL